MTVSFHKYGEYFPGTGDIKVCAVLSYGTIAGGWGTMGLTKGLPGDHGGDKGAGGPWDDKGAGGPWG